MKFEVKKKCCLNRIQNSGSGIWKVKKEDMLEIKVILWHKFKAQPMGTCTRAHTHIHMHALTH